MSDLPTTTLGRTGLRVTRLGYGAMELSGRRNLSLEDAGRILGSILDLGITFIDTSPDYGLAEELIGQNISHRRDEFILATKCGCPVDEPSRHSGAHTFTAQNIRAGVEQSLRRMKTDHLDVVQFHFSPSRALLAQHDALATLETLRSEGKVRFVGISSTLPELSEHIETGVFDTFQIPYSAVERDHEAAITAAGRSGAGTIIRGGIAKGQATSGGPAAGGWKRRMVTGWRRLLWRRARLVELMDGMSPAQFLLRFALSHPQIDTVIVGTATPAHIAENVEAARAGALPDDVYAAAKRRLRNPADPLVTLARRLLR